MGIVVKYDVSGEEPGGGQGEQPQPGIYTAHLYSITHRQERSGGSDDLACMYLIIPEEGDKKNYAPVFDYVGLGESTAWKLAQFMEAIGEAERKKDGKRSGEFVAAEHCVKERVEKSGNLVEEKETGLTQGTKVKLRIKGDSYNNEYKGKIAAVLPYKKSDEEAAEDSLFSDNEEDGEPEENAKEKESSDSEYSYEELVGMRISQLRDVADDLGIEHEGLRKSDLRDEIMEELGLSADNADEDEVPF